MWFTCSKQHRFQLDDDNDDDGRGEGVANDGEGWYGDDHDL